MAKEINTLLSLNKQLHDLIETKLSFEIQNKDYRTFFAAFTIGRAFKTYEAIGNLCRGGYGEDAFMLTRTLFELMVTVIYIFQDTTDDRLIRYVSHDWVTRKEMYDYIILNPSLLSSLKLAIESGGQESTVEEVDTEYKKVMDKYKYEKHLGWSDKNIKGMSEAIGRLDFYNTVYRLQCNFGHANARSMNEYVNIINGGIILDIGPNWDLTRTALVVVFDCFFHIAQEVNEQLKWGIDDALEEVSRKYAIVVGD